MKLVKDILGFTIAILVLIGVVFIPFIGLLYFSGIQYESFRSIISYIIFVFIISFPIEMLEKFVMHTISNSSIFSLKAIKLIDHSIDFFTTLWVIHFVDEWYTKVNIPSVGELIFSVLIVLLSIFLADFDDDDTKS